MTSEGLFPDVDTFVAQLPSLLRRKGDVLVCGGCHRQWRLPLLERCTLANFNYLHEHAQLHWRTASDRKRPHQHFTAG